MRKTQGRRERTAVQLAPAPPCGPIKNPATETYPPKLLDCKTWPSPLRGIASFIELAVSRHSDGCRRRILGFEFVFSETVQSYGIIECFQRVATGTARDGMILDSACTSQ